MRLFFCLFSCSLLLLFSPQAVAACEPEFNEWPPQRPDLENYAERVLTGEGYDGLYDLSGLGDARMLDAKELWKLFGTNGFEYYGMSEIWFSQQYYPRRGAAVALLIPRGGIDPGRDCEDPADTLFVLFDPESWCGVPNMTGVFIGMTPCDYGQQCEWCICGGCGPNDCRPQTLNERGEYYGGGENCRTCVSAVSCAAFSGCSVCYSE